jgi:hypothetical protein
MFFNVTTEHDLEDPPRNPPLAIGSLLRRLAAVLVIAAALGGYLALR